MKLTALKPIIRTKAFHDTITFYTNVLGMELLDISEADGWASLGKDEVTLMVATPNAHNPFEKPQFTGSFYIYTDDVDGLWNRLKDRTGICYEPEVFEWGMKEFAVYDNNGYILQFGQPVCRDRD